jgi:hypothetical protein
VVVSAYFFFFLEQGHDFLASVATGFSFFVPEHAGFIDSFACLAQSAQQCFVSMSLCLFMLSF